MPPAPTPAPPELPLTPGVMKGWFVLPHAAGEDVPAPPPPPLALLLMPGTPSPLLPQAAGEDAPQAGKGEEPPAPGVPSGLFNHAGDAPDGTGLKNGLLLFHAGDAGGCW